jgi:hypothetical protein
MLYAIVSRTMRLPTFVREKREPKVYFILPYKCKAQKPGIQVIYYSTV